MKAGTYYIGDLCYVLTDAEHDEIHNLTFANGDGIPIEGEFKMEDGRDFGQLFTTFEDGGYNDNEGREYSVDSGAIGCIRIVDISSDDKLDRALSQGLGNIVHFHEDFKVENRNGTLCFGSLEIDTGYREDKPDRTQSDDETSDNPLVQDLANTLGLEGGKEDISMICAMATAKIHILNMEKKHLSKALKELMNIRVDCISDRMEALREAEEALKDVGESETEENET